MSPMKSSSGETKSPATILVVDDDFDIRDVTCRVLRGAGFNIIEAATGEEGLETARRVSPDVVLLDVMLPDVEGSEVCRRIKAQPGLEDIFVVLISGQRTGSDNQADGLSAGADGYIARPVGNRELVARVELMLRLRNAKAQLRQEAALLAEARKLESIVQLAGGVAHDFNNMLVIILGHCDMLAEEISDTDPLRIHTNNITSAAERLAKLTLQLLAFARRQTVSPRKLEFDNAVDHALGLLRRLMSEQIELSFAPGAQQRTVWMDPSQLEQMLANLCSNAVDAINGPGEIVIETSLVDDGESEPRFVRLRVTDTGRGMDEQTMPRVFEPFFTTKEVGKGTGMGLATVQGIVAQNRGFIEVSSKLGRGSTFEIRLPLREGP